MNGEIIQLINDQIIFLVNQMRVYENEGSESWSDWYGSDFIPLSPKELF